MDVALHRQIAVSANSRFKNLVQDTAGTGEQMKEPGGRGRMPLYPVRPGCSIHHRQQMLYPAFDALVMTVPPLCLCPGPPSLRLLPPASQPCRTSPPAPPNTHTRAQPTNGRGTWVGGPQAGATDSSQSPGERGVWRVKRWPGRRRMLYPPPSHVIFSSLFLSFLLFPSLFLSFLIPSSFRTPPPLSFSDPTNSTSLPATRRWSGSSCYETSHPRR